MQSNLLTDQRSLKYNTVVYQEDRCECFQQIYTCTVCILQLGSAVSAAYVPIGIQPVYIPIGILYPDQDIKSTIKGFTVKNHEIICCSFLTFLEKREIILLFL